MSNNPDDNLDLYAPVGEGAIFGQLYIHDRLGVVRDFDLDGIRDEFDTDDDDDGVIDLNDAFPFNSAEWLDSDGDGIGNNADPTPNGGTPNTESDKLILPPTDDSHNSAVAGWNPLIYSCLLYTSPSPRDATLSRMPSSA